MRIFSIHSRDFWLVNHTHVMLVSGDATISGIGDTAHWMGGGGNA